MATISTQGSVSATNFQIKALDSVIRFDGLSPVLEQSSTSGTTELLITLPTSYSYVASSFKLLDHTNGDAQIDNSNITIDLNTADTLIAYVKDSVLTELNYYTMSFNVASSTPI